MDDFLRFITYPKWSEGHTDYGRGDVSLPQLIDVWALHTLIFRKQATDSSRESNPWGIENLVGTYQVREAVQDALNSVDNHDSQPLGESGVATLDAVDLMWADFCEPGARPFLEAFTPELSPAPETFWWWDLAPRFGLVRQDLRDRAERTEARSRARLASKGGGSEHPD